MFFFSSGSHRVLTGKGSWPEMPGQFSNLTDELSEAQSGKVTHPRSHSGLVATRDSKMRTLALHCISLAALFLFPGSQMDSSLFPLQESAHLWSSVGVCWSLCFPATQTLPCSPGTLSRLWSPLHLAGSLVLSLLIQNRNRFSLLLMLSCSVEKRGDLQCLSKLKVRMPLDLEILPPRFIL